ncbi:MAG: DUF4446 family protein [bacterium]|nr:DUF4446 family protein [bacterium]
MNQLLQQPLIIVTVFLTAVSAGLSWLIFDLRKKWARYFGNGALPEGQLLKELIEQIRKNEARVGDLNDRTVELEKIAKISVQKVGFLRFNPFQDIGGDQSFSLALLDNKGDGVIISSLYTREGTRVYAKEVSSGKSKQALSEEEKKVLNETLGQA